MNNIAVYKKRGRPSKVVADERVRVVAELIMQGAVRRDITAYAVENFGIQECSINKLLDRANKYIKENYKQDPEAIVNKHIGMYYDLYNTWKNMDASSSIKALNSIEKLLKLHNPETLIQQNTLNVNLDKLSISELKELLNDD